MTKQTKTISPWSLLALQNCNKDMMKISSMRFWFNKMKYENVFSRKSVSKNRFCQPLAHAVMRRSLWPIGIILVHNCVAVIQTSWKKYILEDNSKVKLEYLETENFFLFTSERIILYVAMYEAQELVALVADVLDLSNWIKGPFINYIMPPLSPIPWKSLQTPFLLFYPPLYNEVI